jgi:hypothetical protein
LCDRLFDERGRSVLDELPFVSLADLASSSVTLVAAIMLSGLCNAAILVVCGPAVLARRAFRRLSARSRR